MFVVANMYYEEKQQQKNKNSTKSVYDLYTGKRLM